MGHQQYEAQIQSSFNIHSLVCECKLWRLYEPTASLSEYEQENSETVRGSKNTLCHKTKSRLQYLNISLYFIQFFYVYPTSTSQIVQQTRKINFHRAVAFWVDQHVSIFKIFGSLSGSCWVLHLLQLIKSPFRTSSRACCFAPRVTPMFPQGAGHLWGSSSERGKARLPGRTRAARELWRGGKRALISQIDRWYGLLTRNLIWPLSEHIPYSPAPADELQISAQGWAPRWTRRPPQAARRTLC